MVRKFGLGRIKAIRNIFKQRSVAWGIVNALLLLFLLVGGQVWAAEEPWIDRTTVSGMNIFLQKTKSEVIDLTLLLKSGSGLDPAAKKGTALMMNTLVSLRLKYGPAKLGDAAVETYPDYTLVTLKTTPGNLQKALQEIRDLLVNPLYSYDVIADLKNIYGTDLKSLPAFSKAYYELNRQFYGSDHPYNDNLDPNVFATITGTDVFRWYRQTYQPGNAILSIAGDVDRSIEAIEAQFANLMTEPVDHRLMVQPVTLERDQAVEREDPNGRIASVCIGFPAPRIQDPEYPAFRVLSYYLGEYMHYFEELRVKEGLFYDGEVYYSYLEKPMAPNFVFLTMTEPDTVKTVEERTLAVVRKIAADGIPQAEIQGVVAALETAGKARSASGRGVATLNALSYFMQNQSLYDENLWPKLERVTTADIQKAAAKYLRHYIRVAYVPKEMPDNF